MLSQKSSQSKSDDSVSLLSQNFQLSSSSNGTVEKMAYIYGEDEDGNKVVASIPMGDKSFSSVMDDVFASMKQRLEDRIVHMATLRNRKDSEARSKYFQTALYLFLNVSSTDLKLELLNEIIKSGRTDCLDLAYEHTDKKHFIADHINSAVLGCPHFHLISHCIKMKRKLGWFAADRINAANHIEVIRMMYKEHPDFMRKEEQRIDCMYSLEVLQLARENGCRITFFLSVSRTDAKLVQLGQNRRPLDILIPTILKMYEDRENFCFQDVRSLCCFFVFIYELTNASDEILSSRAQKIFEELLEIAPKHIGAFATKIASYGDYDLVRKMYERGFSVVFGDMLLHACENADLSTIEWLCDAGNKPDQYCYISAAKRGSMEVVSWLYERETSLPPYSNRSKREKEPIDLALDSGNWELAKWFIHKDTYFSSTLFQRDLATIQMVLNEIKEFNRSIGRTHMRGLPYLRYEDVKDDLEKFAYLIGEGYSLPWPDYDLPAKNGDTEMVEIMKSMKCAPFKTNTSIC